ncbi:MAG TPA: 5'-methylthioadenosine/S-adenosylhomocysteine nucleosidase [Kofleriaceae bacterium]|nr:5'-methylthioadenosine/S-adenosylhomocysteine nucleosidase [Kofleriaceae bacterium]
MRGALLMLAACATGAAPGPRAVILISANAEWQAVVQHVPLHVEHSPYGDFAIHTLGGEPVVILHGGYGKTSAAGSTQYAIDRWHPHVLVNLGTAGGFAPDAKVGDIVLVTKTTIYDIYEAMGDAAETIADYASALDTSRWPTRLAARVHPGPIVSGDRDLVPAEVAKLHATYQANVGDWESGSIAFVARKNGVPLIILREVTDVLDADHPSPTTGDLAAWQKQTVIAMKTLLDLTTEAMPDLAR